MYFYNNNKLCIITIIILNVNTLTQINFNGTNFISARLTQRVFLFDPWPNP